MKKQKPLKTKTNIHSLKKELIETSKYFYNRGWMMGTSGNLSALASDNSFIITTSGKDKGNLTNKDFILVNGDGKAVSKNSNSSPSAETLIHNAIYKNTQARFIYHVHTVNITVLSMEEKNSISFNGLEMIKGLGHKTHDKTIHIPIIENSQDMKYIASIIPNHISEEVPGLILRGHGIYAWGNTSLEAKRHIEIFEFLCEYKIRTNKQLPI